MGLGIQEGMLAKIRNGTKKGGTSEQSMRIMNVSYAGTLSINYEKQQLQDGQMLPSSIKTKIKYLLLIWLIQVENVDAKHLEKLQKYQHSHSRSGRDDQDTM